MNLFALIGAGQNFQSNQYIPKKNPDNSIIFIFDSLNFENGDWLENKQNLELKLKSMNESNKLFPFDVDNNKLINNLCENNIFDYENIIIISYTCNFYQSELNNGIFGEKCVFIYYAHEYEQIDLELLLTILNKYHRKDIINMLIKCNELKRNCENLEHSFSCREFNQNELKKYNQILEKLDELFVFPEMNFLINNTKTEIINCNNILYRYFNYKNQEIDETMIHTKAIRNWSKLNFDYQPIKEFIIDNKKIYQFKKLIN